MRQKVKMPISLQGMHIDLQTARLLDILERGKHRAMKEERILQICRTLLATLAFLPVSLGIVVTTGIKPRSQSPVHLFQSCAEGSTELGLYLWGN